MNGLFDFLLGPLLIVACLGCFFIGKSVCLKKPRIIHIIGLLFCMTAVCVLVKKMLYTYILGQLLKHFGLSIFDQQLIDAGNTALITCIIGAVIGSISIVWASKIKMEFED